MKKKWSYFLKGTIIFCIIGMLSSCDKPKEQVEDKKIEETKKEENKDLKEDTTMMAVGNIKIPYHEVLFYIYQLKSNYEDGLTDAIWEYPIGEDETMEHYAKERIISQLTQLKIINSQAEKEKHQLSEEEKVEVENKADAYFNNISEEDKKKYGFTNEFIQSIFLEHAVAAKMFDIVAGTVDTTIEEEEVRQATIQYIKVNKDTEDKTQQKKDKNKAEKLLKEAKKAKDFEEFAETQTVGKAYSITFGKEKMLEDIGEAAFALKTGELSNVIESENGYYIVYCVTENDKEKTAEKKEIILKERQDTAFRESYKEWSSQYKIIVSTPLWEELTFTSIHSR